MRLARFLILAVCVACVAVGCWVYPDGEDLQTDTAIFTRYDQTAVFSSYTTFAINPTIAIVGDTEAGPPPAIDQAPSIIAQVTSKLTAAGYTQVQLPTKPDLGIQVTLVRAVKSAAYIPYYYWGYYGYYGAYYWGYPGYVYYAPWAYTVAIWRANTLVVEAFDLKNVQPGLIPDPGDSGFDAAVIDGGVRAAINCVWSGFVYGVVSSSPTYDVQRAQAGIDQAFLQSPYFHK